MTSFNTRLAVLLLAGAAAWPCLAASSAASSASDSLSTSSAKISDSLTDSSHSSSKDDHQAVGDYRVIEVAEVDGRPDMLRLHLQPTADNHGDDYQLLLPRAAAEHGGVARDVVITALARPYGIAFAAGTAHEAFFLALADDWARELETTTVTL